MSPSAEPRLFALVPCAGVGVRASVGQPKQYALIAGQALVVHTLAALIKVQRLASTLVVLAPDDQAFETAAPDFNGPRAWVCRSGGAKHADSVARGLDELLRRGASGNDWVLVHDAARCLLRPEWVDRLIDACLGDAVGGLLGLPLADTLKQSADGRVAATLPRADKWIAQTPQMFRLGDLQRGLAAAGDAATDESSAIESLGLHPKLIEGDSENFKITWPSDFGMAERVLAIRTNARP